MKQCSVMMLLFLLLSVMFPGCARPGKSNDKISVVCTIFPQYDWVRQILGDRADDMEVTLLLDSGIDLHSYQPSADDMITVSTCDLFIYAGGESDSWVEGALTEASNPDMIVVNLLETLGNGAKVEEIVEGMEEEEGEEEEGALDEHVWLSLKNAEIFCARITDALSSLDAANAETYRGNLAAYREKLSALDAEYQAAADAASTRTLLFGDRFPFRYLADDYGLSYHAAFPGCSAETEASFETIVFLAKKMDELSLENIMVTESSDQSIAKTVRDNTVEKNQRILAMNALQSVVARDVENGATYLSIMESNLNTLKQALR